MTNKELRVKIYSWLFDNFKIKYSDINKSQYKSLKNILEEFNPTSQQSPVPRPIIRTPRVEPKKKEYINTKGPIKVWRNF